MIIKQCHLVNNMCYKYGVKMDYGKPVGIIVHSTSSLTPNNTLKRYVQPDKNDKNYTNIIEDIGINFYGNSWNNPPEKMGSWACVHAFIGMNAHNEIETYETLPHNYCCWGVGAGDKGSYNDNPYAHFQFEICEDNTWDSDYNLIEKGSEDYFIKAMKEAQEYCGYICKLYNIPVNKVISHAEAHKQGYGCNHGDIDHWLNIYGKTMDWFRTEVALLIGENVAVKKDIFRVQVGAFVYKKNAYNLEAKLKSIGYECFVTHDEDLDIYRVQLGAFSIKGNALKLVAELMSKGYTAFIVKS